MVLCQSLFQTGLKMQKRVRIINVSLWGRGSWEPGCYAAFALGPLLSASTVGTPRSIPGTPGASLLPGQRGWGDALGTRGGGTWAQRVQGRKKHLPVVVQRGFCRGVAVPRSCRHRRASQASSWGCRRSAALRGRVSPSALPWAPCCALFGGERRSALYCGRRMSRIRHRPLLQTCSRQAVGAEAALDARRFTPKFTVSSEVVPCRAPYPPSLQQALSPDPSQSF